MTFLIIILIITISYIIYVTKRNKKAKEAQEGKVLSQKNLFENNTSYGVKISAVTKIIDEAPIKKANAENIIKYFKRPYTIEQSIIKDNPLGFIYYVNSYYSRIGQIKYNIEKNLPRDYSYEINYVTFNDNDKIFTERKFWDWAVKFNLADKGYLLSARTSFTEKSAISSLT
jgi:hypothetical protein